MTPALVAPIPTVAHPGWARAMIHVARVQVGYHEGHNSSGWTNDNAFGVWYGMNKVAWCAIFQSWCAHFSGCGSIIPRFSYTPAGRAWFVKNNQWHANSPVEGDLAFFYSSSQGRIHHVGLVESVNSDGSFYTIEGNSNNTGSAEGDGVYRLHRNRASLGGGISGFGRPKYAGI